MQPKILIGRASLAAFLAAHRIPAAKVGFLLAGAPVRDPLTGALASVSGSLRLDGAAAAAAAAMADALPAATLLLDGAADAAAAVRGGGGGGSLADRADAEFREAAVVEALWRSSDSIEAQIDLIS